MPPRVALNQTLKCAVVATLTITVGEKVTLELKGEPIKVPPLAPLKSCVPVIFTEELLVAEYATPPTKSPNFISWASTMTNCLALTAVQGAPEHARVNPDKRSTAKSSTSKICPPPDFVS
jgi:hypothetical protein